MKITEEDFDRNFKNLFYEYDGFGEPYEAIDKIIAVPDVYVLLAEYYWPKVYLQRANELHEQQRQKEIQEKHKKQLEEEIEREKHMRRIEIGF